MKSRKRMLTVLMITAVLMLAVALPLLTSGCGASTPEQAVRNFMKAFSDKNLDVWLTTILPDNVRKMTPTDMQFWKTQAFGTVVFEVNTMTMSTKLKGNSSATVTVTAGKIVIKNALGNGSDVVLDIGKQQYTSKDASTGKVTTTPFGDREKQIAAQLGTYQTSKFKGGWYVDYDLQRAASGG